MKYKNVIFILVSCLLLAQSCSSYSDENPQDVADSLPQYEISVIDSFGVEIGDSINMISSIDGFCHTADGSLVLLDRIAMKIKIVSETGEVVCWGTSGEGPGEFLLPKGICVMTDGRILISDTHKREVMEFDTSGNYLGSYIIENEESIPFELFQVDSNSVVGSKLGIEFGEDQIRYSYFVGRFDSSSNPSVLYEEFTCDLSSPEIYNVLERLDFYADPSGRVFIASDNTKYLINVLTDDGVLLHTIQQSVARIAKTEDEIQTETDEYEQLAADNPSYASGFEPNAYHPLISLAGVDNEGNLWVQLFNQENKVNFDVYTPSGELVFTVSLEESITDETIVFQVDSYGILGAVINSSIYPRIYIFELANSE